MNRLGLNVNHTPHSTGSVERGTGTFYHFHLVNQVGGNHIVIDFPGVAG